MHRSCKEKCEHPCVVEDIPCIIATATSAPRPPQQPTLQQPNRSLAPKYPWLPIVDFCTKISMVDNVEINHFQLTADIDAPRWDGLLHSSVTVVWHALLSSQMDAVCTATTDLMAPRHGSHQTAVHAVCTQHDHPKDMYIAHSILLIRATSRIYPFDNDALFHVCPCTCTVVYTIPSPSCKDSEF